MSSRVTFLKSETFSKCSKCIISLTAWTVRLQSMVEEYAMGIVSVVIAPNHLLASQTDCGLHVIAHTGFVTSVHQFCRSNDT